MKCILIFYAVLSSFRVLSGYVFPVATDTGTRFIGNLRYSAYDLHYGTSGTFSGVPGHSYGPSELPYGFSGLSYTSTPYGPFGTIYVPTFEEPCNYQITNEILTDFRIRIFKYIPMLFKKAVILSEGNLAISPNTIWLTMAAIAEATDGPTRQELFSLLHVPEDRCLRQFFYQLCTTREYSSNDVVLIRNRFFIADSFLHINRNWEAFARSQTHLNTISIPFKHNPFGEIDLLKRAFNVQLPNLNLNGNSFLLETLDYRGLWTSAFSDAVIETGPFYNNFGKQIGTMEYMKIRQRAKSAYIKSINTKLLELSVGKDARYKMLFATIPGNQEFGRFVNNIKEDAVFESLGKMTVTSSPIDIVIPKLTITNEIDVRRLLEELGIKNLWTNPSATRNISDPAALPSSYIQRVSIVIDDSGVQPPVPEYSDIVHDVYTGYSLHDVSGLSSTGSPSYLPPVNVHTRYAFHAVSEIPDTDSLREFVANRPFLFAFFDSETYTALFAGKFSKPEH